jgi:hypothetical protein
MGLLHTSGLSMGLVAFVWAVNGPRIICLGYQWAWLSLYGPLVGLAYPFWAINGPKCVGMGS